MRDYEGAKKSHQEALAIFRKSHPQGHPDIADSLNNLGAAQRLLRDYEGAKNSHEEALGIRRKSLKPDDPLIPQSLSNLGTVQRDLRDYEGARQSFESALAIFRKALKPDDPLIAQGLSNLGIVLDDLRDYEGAKTSHQEALEIRHKALKPDDARIADSLNNLGNAQHALREFEAAKISHDKALAVRCNALKPDDPLIAQSLINLGNVQAGLRDYTGAKKSYQEALAILRKALPEGHADITDSLHNLGVIDLALGGPTAITAIHLSEALTTQRSNLLVLAGSQVEAEQFAAGLDAWKTLSVYLSAALASDAGVDTSDVYDWAGGLKGLVTARQRWARELRDDADLDIRRLLDQLQMVNLRLLRAALGSDKIGGKGVDRGANAAVELAHLDAERKVLERQLANRSDAFRRYQQKAKLGGAAIQASLPPGCCLVDFLVYARVGPPPKEKADPVTGLRLMAFVLRPGDVPVRFIDLGPADRIGTLVDAWRERYVSRNPGKAGEVDPATELRKLVWEPVEKHLGKPGVVLVSPDGPLNYLPLAALPGGANGKFLVHEYGFAVVPAPVLLPDLMARKPARLNNPSLLLVGGIDFGKEAGQQIQTGKIPAVPTNWKALAWTSREVNDIQEQFKKAYPGAQAPLILEKDKATKGAVLGALPGSAYVHLATHGFFADEAETSILDVRRGPNPVRLDRAVSGRHPGVLSGLVFAGVNNPPDGAVDGCLLTALEARELDLRGAELVVMSACDTGSGRTAASEGVLGLQRAFHVGGARSVVATQWMVPDAPTRVLIGEFYKRLWGQDLVSKAEALRQAQVLMIDKWDIPRGDFRGPTEPKDDAGPLPPYFWAAFTLSGDWR